MNREPRESTDMTRLGSSRAILHVHCLGVAGQIRRLGEYPWTGERYQPSPESQTKNQVRRNGGPIAEGLASGLSLPKPVGPGRVDRNDRGVIITLL